jgi:MFS family permease
MINLKDARQVIAAAEAKAHELHQPMNIAVVDRPTPPTRAGSPICWCPTTRSVKYWWRRATWSRRLNPSATASPSESALGFVAAGAVAAWMLPLYGWRSLLLVGAISPLALAVFIYWFLPESIDFLVRNKADPRRIWTVLHRIDPLLTSEPPGDFLTDLVERKSAVGSLFQSGRTFGTLLLWVVFFLNLAEFYALQSWLPAILTSLNYPLNTIALATSLTTVGGILAVFVVGPAMDRLAPFGSLAALYFVGVFFVALTGPALSSPEWALLTATFFAGFCVSGGLIMRGALDDTVEVPASNTAVGHIILENKGKTTTRKRATAGKTKQAALRKTGHRIAG